jgi:glycosyltransferase involved in cell wall biosynthesis
MAGPNVTFLGALDDAGVAAEYARARAVLFTPHLEYGLVPLEAVASGTPVIAYGEGGIRETMIGLGEKSETQGPPTALFFHEQTAESIGAAIRAFRPEDYPAAALVKHAEAWGVPAFRERLTEMVLRAARTEKRARGPRP